MASTEVLEQPPKKHNKTCVLRVSIHCEGCKRKVKKLLQSLPGVEDIEIERQQQRVVVTGDVLPEALLNKLLKSGKHAQFWPENPPEIHAPKVEKPLSTSQVSASEESVVSGKEAKSTVHKLETPVEDRSKSAKASVAGGGHSSGKVEDGVGKAVEVDVKAEEKKPGTRPAGGQTSARVVENKEQAMNNDRGSGGGGEEKVKKKKKKKPQNSTINGNGNNSGGPFESIPRSNGSPPRHHGYDYPPYHHYMPPLPAPVYTMSYNTAHPPANSYTASYYAPLPPQSYAYSHMEMPAPHVVSGYESYTQQQQPRYESYVHQQPPVDTFEMLSDENPNGCLVM